MDDDSETGYSGAETTGFQSPAQDHIERGIRDGDILIATRRRGRRMARSRWWYCSKETQQRSSYPAL